MQSLEAKPLLVDTSRITLRQITHEDLELMPTLRLIDLKIIEKGQP